MRICIISHLLLVFLHSVTGFTLTTDDVQQICGSENWTLLDLKIIQDVGDIKRLTSNKCALNLRIPANGRLTKKVMDLLPKHHLKLLQISGELQVLDDDSLSSLKSLKYLKLSNLNLEKSDIFKSEGKFPKHLQLLDLSHNGLNNLTFFKTESKKMLKINVHDNHLHTVPKELKVFGNLQEIVMNHNKIENFSLDSTLINVVYLDVSYNIIRNLSGLQHFPNLVVLNLTSNSIHEIREEYFENERSNLQELLLDNNFIEFIPIRILLNFPKLKIFSIANNKLRKLIPTTENYRTTEIEYLNLGSNSLDDIPFNFLKWFPFLKTLKLNNNKLSYLRSGTFARLNNLQHLDLSNNEIVNFNVKRLIPLESLSALNLSNNKIEIIDYFSLALHIPNLRVINIDENSLFCENLIETLRFFDNNAIEVEKGKCREREHIRDICCVDGTKNYTDLISEGKFNMVSFSLITQNQKNSKKLDELLKTFSNATVKKESPSSMPNEGLVITKATFWTGLGIIIAALCLILFVLLLSLFAKKKEILPVHL